MLSSPRSIGIMSDLDLESVLQKHLEVLRNKTLELTDHELLLADELDALFLVVMSIIIFAMQCGFAFLEAGTVRNVTKSFSSATLYEFCLRSKNTVNILIKNMLDAFIGATSYWAIGWGLAYGEDGNLFCGGSEYFNYSMDYEKYPKWFFQVKRMISLK